MEVGEKFKNCKNQLSVSLYEIEKVKHKDLSNFINHALLQMLELLEEQLSETFDAVEFCYKGILHGVEFNGKNPEDWTSQFAKILPLFSEQYVNIQFSLHCSLTLSDDVQFWGYTTSFSFTFHSDMWYLNFKKESIPLNTSLSIRNKRLLLRHIYFHILDDYNNNY